MKTNNLKLDFHLSNQGLGPDGYEIAEYVEEMDEWTDYVNKINSEPIPADENGNPTDEFMESRTFFADHLISIACEKLGWHSIPQTGGLEEHYYPEGLK